MHKIAIPQAAIDRVLKRRKRARIQRHRSGAHRPYRGRPAERLHGRGSPPNSTAREIVPNVNRISAALRAAGGLVVYIQNTIDATAKDGWSNWFTYMSGEGAGKPWMRPLPTAATAIRSGPASRCCRRTSE